MVWTFGAGQQRGLAAAERATGSSCGRRRWKKKKKLKKIPEKILDARGLETPPPPNETRRQVTCFQSSINPNPQADFFSFFQQSSCERELESEGQVSSSAHPIISITSCRPDLRTLHAPGPKGLDSQIRAVNDQKLSAQLRCLGHDQRCAAQQGAPGGC